MNALSIISLNTLLISSIIIFSSLLLTVPFLFIKKQISSKWKMHLYSFTSGITIILATFGFLRESYHLLENHFILNKTNDLEKVSLIIVIIVSGVLMSAIFYLFIEWLSSKRLKKTAQCNHNHVEHILNLTNDHEHINASIAISALLIHKLIDGLSLGFLISTNNQLFIFNNVGLIVSFLIHMLPILIISNFFQLDLKIKKIKIVINTLLISLFMVLFTFVGTFTGYFTINIYWLLPFLFSMSGGILVLMSIMELVPEFIKNRSAKAKTWYITIFFFITGMILSLILSLIHTHSG